jgi:ribose transport system substrate-binding protein
VRRFPRLVICLVATTFVVSCSSNSSTGTGPLTVAFVTNNSSDFWTIARRGVEKADAELADVTAEFRIDSDGTAAEQKRIVDDLLTKRVAGIAISPVDPQNQTQLLDDAAKQALVFTQDSDAPASVSSASSNDTIFTAPTLPASRTAFRIAGPL